MELHVTTSYGAALRCFPNLKTCNAIQSWEESKLVKINKNHVCQIYVMDFDRLLKKKKQFIWCIYSNLLKMNKRALYINNIYIRISDIYE